MPRVPAGWHRQASAGTPGGFAPQRFTATGQAQYWRQSVTELHASAQAVFPPLTSGGGAVTPVPQFAVTASTGPTAAGEIWSASIVQVQTGTQYGQPPLLAQQIAAQVEGLTTTPPPPIPAQAWLSAGGTNLHLLAQTTQGGYDNLDLSGQVIRTGEQLTVTWWISETVSPVFITSAWFVLRGTRHTLSVT